MSVSEKFETFSPVRTFIFLVGTGGKKECMDLNAVCEVLNIFLKHLQEEEWDNERTELVIMQYAEEGLRKVLYLDLTDVDSILDLQFEIHGHPTSPFKAFNLKYMVIQHLLSKLWVKLLNGLKNERNIIVHKDSRIILFRFFFFRICIMKRQIMRALIKRY